MNNLTLIRDDYILAFLLQIDYSHKKMIESWDWAGILRTTTQANELIKKGIDICI